MKIMVLRAFLLCILVYIYVCSSFGGRDIYIFIHTYTYTYIGIELTGHTICISYSISTYRQSSEVIVISLNVHQVPVTVPVVHCLWQFKTVFQPVHSGVSLCS